MRDHRADCTYTACGNPCTCGALAENANTYRWARHLTLEELLYALEDADLGERVGTQLRALAYEARDRAAGVDRSDLYVDLTMGAARCRSFLGGTSCASH